MSGKYQAYPEYKDSVIEWLEQVPEHWGVSKLRYMFSFSKGLTITKANLLDDGVPCVNYGEVHSKYNFEVDPAIHPLKCVSEEYLKSSQNSLLSYGDFVFADTSEDIEGSGNFTQLISHEKVFAGYHTIIVRPNDKQNSRFYAYLLDSQEFRTQIRYAVKGVKVFSVTQAILRGIDIWLPTLEERRKIANFLDHETTKIDTLIEKQQQLIKLLKEKRQAVISHAVTKGLNPNAPMRDSGVEWLGEVPEHWDVAGFKKYLNKIVDYRGKTPEKHDAGIFLVTARNIKNGGINYTASQEYVSKEDYEDIMSRGKPKIGDILFTTEAPLGEVASVDREDIALAQRVIKFDGQSGVLNNEYIKYFIMSNQFQQSLMMFASGSTALGIKAQRLVYLRMLIPPENEQLKIVEYVETIITKIDDLIDKAIDAIKIMQERRTALISAAVTGKIDVRNWQPPKSSNNLSSNKEVAA